jgi:hypothetical protein
MERNDSSVIQVKGRLLVDPSLGFVQIVSDTVNISGLVRELSHAQLCNGQYVCASVRIPNNVVGRIFDIQKIKL